MEKYMVRIERDEASDSVLFYMQDIPTDTEKRQKWLAEVMEILIKKVNERYEK